MMNGSRNDAMDGTELELSLVEPTWKRRGPTMEASMDPNMDVDGVFGMIGGGPAGLGNTPDWGELSPVRGEPKPANYKGNRKARTGGTVWMKWRTRMY